LHTRLQQHHLAEKVQTTKPVGTPGRISKHNP
jgi:hypothetical protein